MSRCALVLCVALLVALVVQPQSVKAQQGKYVTEATSRLTKLIDAANRQGYKLTDDSFSLGGGWLKQGNGNWVALYTISLNAGANYRFVGAGDYDCTDLDLEIQDPNGRVVRSDTSTASDAIVDFSPNVSGRYLIRLRLYASRNNLPCFCTAIAMRK